MLVEREVDANLLVNSACILIGAEHDECYDLLDQANDLVWVVDMKSSCITSYLVLSTTSASFFGSNYDHI